MTSQRIYKKHISQRTMTMKLGQMIPDVDKSWLTSPVRSGPQTQCKGWFAVRADWSRGWATGHSIGWNWRELKFTLVSANGVSGRSFVRPVRPNCKPTLKADLHLSARAMRPSTIKFAHAQCVIFHNICVRRDQILFALKVESKSTFRTRSRDRMKLTNRVLEKCKHVRIWQQNFSIFLFERTHSVLSGDSKHEHKYERTIDFLAGRIALAFKWRSALKLPSTVHRVHHPV